MREEQIALQQNLSAAVADAKSGVDVLLKMHMYEAWHTICGIRLDEWSFTDDPIIGGRGVPVNTRMQTALRNVFTKGDAQYWAIIFPGAALIPGYHTVMAFQANDETLSLRLKGKDVGYFAKGHPIYNSISPI
jgi:predicted secreted protein